MAAEALPRAGAAALVGLRRQYNHPQMEGDLTLGIEYLSYHGRAMEFFWVQVSGALTGDARLDGRTPESVKLYQEADGSWQLQLRTEDSKPPVCWLWRQEDVDALLDAAAERLYARPAPGEGWDGAEEE